MARLTGTTFPSFADDETSLDALQERVARTAALLRGVTPAAFEHSEDREISIGSGAGKRVFKGTGYLFGFGLPNFYFHLATAYGLLRHHGVALGKRDFLGNAGKATPAPAAMQPPPER